MPIYSAPNFNLPNVDLNELSSQFATDFGHDTTFLIQRITNRDVWDADPQQFLDLKLLNMFGFEQEASDEFNFQEATMLGTPIQAAGAAATVTSPTTQTFKVASLDEVATDVVIVYENNARGTITSINTSASEITITPQTGGTLPAVVIGDQFAHLSTIDANRRDGFPAFFREAFIERTNFVQTIAYATTFTKKEMWKFNKAGTVDDFVGRQRSKLMQWTRTRLSNVFWNGEKGEVTLADGSKEKTTGGVFPTMLAAGSPNTSTTITNIRSAFENIVGVTEFGEFGATRFAFMDSLIHRELSKEFKDDKIRFRPDDDDVVKLTLRMIDLGSSKIVLVPFSRFKDKNAFPPAFEKRIIIIDPKNIKIKQLWGDMSGETLDRSGGVAKTFTDTFVETQIGVRINNPQAFGFIDIT